MRALNKVSIIFVSFSLLCLFVRGPLTPCIYLHSLFSFYLTVYNDSFLMVIRSEFSSLYLL